LTNAFDDVRKALNMGPGEYCRRLGDEPIEVAQKLAEGKDKLLQARGANADHET
jgi:hypothetical protein